ncbi:hypothetical protein [Photorhabdus bodei]
MEPPVQQSPLTQKNQQSDPAQATDRSIYQFFGEGIQGPICLFSVQSESS